MGNDWKQGLCGCLGEPEVCLCGLCIPCCLVKQNADNLGKVRVTLTYTTSSPLEVVYPVHNIQGISKRHFPDFENM